MCQEVQIKVPHAPPEKAPVINLIETGADKSFIITGLSGVARGMIPALGGIVTSTKAPSFKPDFRGTYAGDEEQPK
jgi:hypothetical protein